MRNAALAAGCFIVLALALTTVHAGTVLVVETWAYDQFSESGTTTTYLGGDKVRVEFLGKESVVQILYDMGNKDAPVMWILNPKEQTYTTMDMKAIEKTKAQVQAFEEMMKNYTLKMSDEERAEFKTKYGKEIRQADELLGYDERMKKIVYEKVASGEKVKNWTCEHVKGTVNKQPYKEVWVASWSDLGVEPADLASLDRLVKTFNAFAGDVTSFNAQKVSGSDAPLNGFPVKIVYFEDGNKFLRQELKELRKEELDPKLFTLPEGFTEAPAAAK
jgi:hypothetical protein